MRFPNAICECLGRRRNLTLSTTRRTVELLSRSCNCFSRGNSHYFVVHAIRNACVYEFGSRGSRNVRNRGPKFMSDSLQSYHKKEIEYKERERRGRANIYGNRFAQCSKGRQILASMDAIKSITNRIRYRECPLTETHPSLRRDERTQGATLIVRGDIARWN